VSVVRGAGAGPGGVRPVLSVIIACLDGEDTLGTQLHALAVQPCPVPWELILCDNGSTDGTVALAESYRSRLPELRIIDASAVRGAGPARNYGVQVARGRWVAFCDADDEVASDWLTTMAAALRDHRFVAGRFEKYRLNATRVLRSRPLQQQDELQSSDIGAGMSHAGGGNMGMHRADFLRIGGFDPQIRWLEDTDLSWRAQLSGIPLSFCPEVVVHVRLRNTFRTMYVQGYQYGLAHAWLEERYGRPGVRGAQGACSVKGPEGASHGVHSLWARFVDHVIAGRLAWRAGWVAGHRHHRRGSVGEMPYALESLAEGRAETSLPPPSGDPARTGPVSSL
jgi:hypothetical protein